MTTTRKQYSPKFKARVAVEAIRGDKTLSQLGSQFKVHPMQIAKWRKAALEQLPELFVDGRSRKGRNEDADKDALYEEIGRLKMELDWLKKKEFTADATARRAVHANAILREATDAGLAAGSGLRGEPQAGRASDGVDRDRGDLPEAKAERTGVKGTRSIRICWRASR